MGEEEYKESIAHIYPTNSRAAEIHYRERKDHKAIFKVLEALEDQVKELQQKNKELETTLRRHMALGDYCPHTTF